ncbi:FG-GAP-like repeat-containing protein [Polaromonas sp. A23]|uniref:FG-GAP-like repeat-containing protein n=1 Tax=Polaromonas sp. A23 TaxID=1944133 RepID=UPI00098584DD|nr:FG-GAP-like repeat-containing protein [Polaromonas sp. A23]OOG39665.1 hypothetical protein B0B52_13560 [Polaromonas sp. A23]
MNKRYSRVLTGIALSLGAALVAGSVLAQTTVAGTTPGQFSVNESGAATYSIPIQVPPGVAGMQPQLFLEYNSQSGNGLLGMGWSLSGLSAITRCPRTMAQDGVRGGVNYDMNDRFCLDGQRLLLISGTEGVAGAEYRTERESFSKITAHGSAGNGPAYFIVKTKAGLTMEYGNTADSRIEAQGKAHARLWGVNKIIDVRGNYLTAVYVEDNANGQYYTSRVDYTGSTTSGSSPANSIQLLYETRPDVAPMYHAGSLLKNTVRMTKVQTYIGTTLVKEYRLSFDNSGAVGSSRLTGIAECGGDGVCLQGTTPGWLAGGDGTFDSRIISSADTHFAGHRLVTGDINGDGRLDLMYITDGSNDPNGNPTRKGEHRSVFLGLGDGTFAPRVITAADTHFDWHELVTGDINGDGKLDILYITDGTFPYGNASGKGQQRSVFLGVGDGTFGPRIISSADTHFAGHRLVTGDINGDGRLDLMYITDGSNDPNGNPTRKGEHRSVFLGLGDGTFAPRVITAADTHFDWHDLVTGDINGDGKLDILYITDGTFPYGNMSGKGQQRSVFLGVGDGTFGPRVISSADTHFGWHELVTGDVNGDGKLDILYITDGTFPHGNMSGKGQQRSAFLGLGDGTFSPRIISSADTHFGWHDQVPGDFNGDGKLDILYITDGTFPYGGDSGKGQQRSLFLGLGDGNFAPRIISSADTHFGWHELVMGDVNGDGKLDVAYITDGTFPYGNASGRGQQRSTFFGTPISGSPDSMISVTSGQGATTSLNYKPLPDNAVYTRDASPNAAVYPKIDLQYPQYVVSTVSTSNGVGGVNTVQYNYGGLKAEQGTGRGLLGFRWMKSKSVANNIESYTEFNQNHPFTGTVAKNETRLAGSGNAGLLKRTTNTYAQSPGSAGTSVFVYPSQSVEESWDLSGTPYPNATTSYVYGQSPQYGDPTQITVSNSEGSSKTTVNEYWPANTGSGNWILGRLKKASVTSVKP